MATHLPARPHLDHLRSQAKTLLADFEAGAADAVNAFIAHLPAAKGMTPAAARRVGFRLADAQSVVARKAGFESWARLARHVERLRALEGEWQFVSLEVDGSPMPTGLLSTSRLLIDGDRFRMESPEATYEGVLAIDVAHEPATIDIEFVEGPEAGKWSYGIFELTDDTLTLCLGLTGAPRPRAFATAAGSGHALERLRRASAARPAGVHGGTRTPRPGADRAIDVASDAATAAATGAAEAPIDDASFEGPMTPLLERLQGEWTPTLLVSSGAPLADAMLAFGSRAMRGTEMKVVFGGQTMVHAKVRIDETTRPIAIDYLNIGRGSPTVSHGIFEWKGDEIRVCMAGPGAPRPREFASSAGDGRTLSQWRRRSG